MNFPLGFLGFSKWKRDGPAKRIDLIMQLMNAIYMAVNWRNIDGSHTQIRPLGVAAIQ